jgi:RNA polymerase sigma-70 factor (ECF subfamily)
MGPLRRVLGVEAVPVELTDEARTGSAFEDFFRSEYRRVLGLALALCGRPAVAEELAQDAFVSAYRHWDRVGSYDDPGAWIRRVVVNLATSALRRRSREVRALARLASRREPEQALLAVDDDEFWKAVRALPRRQAQCVALRYLEDRTTEEVAVILGIAVPTVRVHLHAARAALASRFGEQLDEETQ